LTKDISQGEQGGEDAQNSDWRCAAHHHGWNILGVSTPGVLEMLSGQRHTSDGHCVSYCSGDCNGRLPMRLMLSTSQCADEYRALICDGPRCKLVCVGAKR